MQHPIDFADASYCTPHTAHKRTFRRFLLRKLALLAPLCAFLFFAQFASAQQVDAFLGGGTVTSSGSCNDASGLCPEKGGLYINLGGDVVFYKQLGVNVETAWRAT